MVASSMICDLEYLRYEPSRHGRHCYYVVIRRRRSRLIGIDTPPPLAATRQVLRAYEAARAKLENVTKTNPNNHTIEWLIERFYGSADFRHLHKLTQADYRSALKPIIAEYPRLPYKQMERRDVQALADKLTGHPRNKRLKALKRVFGWACEQNYVRINPTIGIKRHKVGSTGVAKWSLEDVETFFDHHHPGTQAHLMLSILLFTAARISDVARMGPLTIRRDRLVFVQKKNEGNAPIVMNIPLLPPLRQALVLAEDTLGETTWLTTDYGEPFSIKGLGNWFRKRCDEAGLKHLSAHGVRKLTATAAADNGASTKQIQELLGHSTPDEAETYVRESNRKRLANDGFSTALAELENGKART